jgi:hypothetical protein
LNQPNQTFEDDHFLVDASDNFGYYFYKVSKIDKKIARQVVETRRTLSPYAQSTLIDARNVDWIDFDAMKILNSKIAFGDLKFVAILASSNLVAMIGNLFNILMSKKQSFQSKIFTDPIEAIEWLNLKADLKIKPQIIVDLNAQNSGFQNN